MKKVTPPGCLLQKIWYVNQICDLHQKRIFTLVCVQKYQKLTKYVKIELIYQMHCFLLPDVDTSSIAMQCDAHWHWQSYLSLSFLRLIFEVVSKIKSIELWPIGSALVHVLPDLKYWTLIWFVTCWSMTINTQKRCRCILMNG